VLRSQTKNVDSYLTHWTIPTSKSCILERSTRPIARSRRGANRIKRNTPVMVVIGKSSLLREGQRKGTMDRGAWRRLYLQTRSGCLQGRGGLGKYEYVLSNLYVYFLAVGPTWKVF